MAKKKKDEQEELKLSLHNQLTYDCCKSFFGMTREEHKLLFDWIFCQCAELWDDQTEKELKEEAEHYFKMAFEYGYAERYLKMAKNGESYDAYLFRFMEE